MSHIMPNGDGSMLCDMHGICRAQSLLAPLQFHEPPGYGQQPGKNHISWRNLARNGKHADTMAHKEFFAITD